MTAGWVSEGSLSVCRCGFGRDVNGFRTLVLASDNNFSASQTTQFHVFRTDIPAVPRRTLGTMVLGNGSLTAAPSVAWYPEGSEVTLDATPAAGFVFSDWSGSLSGSNNPASLMMDADRTVAARFVSTYQSWKIGYFTSEEIAGTQLSEPISDPEGDGLQNLLEYALNLHPREPSVAGLPSVGGVGGNLTLTYLRDTSKPDISYQVEVSDSLAGWGVVSDELVSTTGTIETRKATIPVDGPKRFLRLKITQLF
jgi:hypothetical protein